MLGKADIVLSLHFKKKSRVNRAHLSTMKRRILSRRIVIETATLPLQKEWRQGAARAMKKRKRILMMLLKALCVLRDFIVLSAWKVTPSR